MVAKIAGVSRRSGAHALNHATRVLTSAKLKNRYCRYHAESLTLCYAGNDIGSISDISGADKIFKAIKIYSSGHKITVSCYNIILQYNFLYFYLK